MTTDKAATIHPESNPDWFGIAPPRWDTKQLKHVVRLQSGEAITAEAIRPEGEFEVFGGNGKRGYAPTFTHFGEYALIGRQGALCGNVNVAKGKFWASEHAVVAIPWTSAPIGWLSNLLGAMDLGQYSVSAAQPGLSVDVISRIKVPVPPPEEQQAIALYLDRETGQIDALLAKQQQLVETLIERLQVMTTQAVTRGLDPNVVLKASGIPTLESIPENWAPTYLRYVIKSVTSGVSVNAIDLPASEEEIGVLKTSCVYSGEFDASQNKSVDEAEVHLVACPVVQGRLIVSRMNTPSLVGAAGFVRTDHPRLYLPDRLWQVDVNCDAEFLHLWMQSDSYRHQIRIAAVGTSSSMQNLSQGAFRAVAVALPPRSEQASIVTTVRAKAAKINALVDKVREVIVVLKERRQALISAAITGKIDVRGL